MHAVAEEDAEDAQAEQVASEDAGREAGAGEAHLSRAKQCSLGFSNRGGPDRQLGSLMLLDPYDKRNAKKVRHNEQQLYLLKLAGGASRHTSPRAHEAEASEG